MNYPSIRIEGAILSPDILDSLHDDTIGQRPGDFGLDSGVKVKDEIARAWADAQDYWRIFQRKLDTLKPDSPATTETRNLWMVPLLGVLGYQLEYQAKAAELNGKTYAISHRVTNRAHASLHIIGCREPAGLDRKPERTHIGTPRMSAHGLVQEYLNLHDELYGIVTNGRVLRLLRDSSRLIKLTYLEFDLDRIFSDGLFADFAVLYRLLHATRLPVSRDSAAESLLERYHQDSLDSGARIREGLSKAVEQAIKDFANGFLSYPHNDALRSQISAGKLSAEDYYSYLLHLIYRLLFLMVIEERGLVFPNHANPQHRDIYQNYYSLQRLRRLAEKRHLADQRHHDLWLSLLTTFQLFESETTAGKLGLKPLAGDLFSPQAIAILGQSSLANDVLLGCLRSLSLYQHPDNGQLLRVNYAALNVEEFGSVYEGLLEYQPMIWRVGSGERRVENDPLETRHAPLTNLEFGFKQGDQRAATGSHYTPDELVQPLIKHSLDYLIIDRLANAKKAAGSTWQTLAAEYRNFFVSEIYGVLSRPGNLAAGDDFGRVRVLLDEIVSKGRIIRHDQPDSTGSRVDSGQHSRGLGATLDQGVSTIPTDSQRQPQGSGNSSTAQPTGRTLHSGGDTATIDGSDHPGQTNPGPTTLTVTQNQLADLWSALPLAARHSLLAAQALLSLRVADIACGSGHILLAAARRIAIELAIVRTGEEQPSPPAIRTATRDVIKNCIYGVDLNPLAVELCKVALWLEAHIPGEPLNFLDHHIKCGNAIVGFSKREELERGIPDEAFATQPGDEKDIAALFRKKNKEERNKQGQMLVFDPVIEQQLDAILNRWQELSKLPEQTPTQIDQKKQRFIEFSQSQDAWTLNEIAALPIAQFYIEKTNANKYKLITDAEYRRFLKGQQTPQGQAVAEAFGIALKKRFFHWFLEFPEIMARGGFDCILGNPPYLGGQALSGTYGHSFCGYVKWEYAPTGLSDLVVFFLRRIYSLLHPNGFTAFITTNSIKDGDIRKDGLEQVLSQDGVINMAVRGIKWPGLANLVVSLVSIHNGIWQSKRILDGKEVPFINAFFEDTEDLGEPARLPENVNLVFMGSIPLGDGFILNQSEVDNYFQNKQYFDEIQPLLNGQEVNSDPKQEPSRYVINLERYRTLESAEIACPELVERIRLLVLPDRLAQKNSGAKEKWWRYYRHNSLSYEKSALLGGCFVTAATTKYLNFSWTQSGRIFTHALFTFTTDRWDLYTIVQSTLHEVWARKYSGALETRLRYSPSDCFETFPFPEGLWQTAIPTLADIGKRYHEHRRALMLQLWLGLTDIYNLFHTRDLTPEKVAKVSKKSPEEAQAGYQGLLELRRLHAKLDTAVRDAYGWHDIDLGHDFHEVETLPENDRVRYTISPATRKEVLKRLLAENHSRAAEQTASTPEKPKAKRGKKEKANDDQSDIFQ